MSDLNQIFNDLLDSRPSVGAVNRANDKTIPGGIYKAEIVKKSELEPASDQSPWPGRAMVKIQADAFELNGDGEYHKKGRLFFDVSPQEMSDKRGRLDGPSKLWVHFVNLAGKGASNREVLEYIGQYPVMVSVTRTFKTVEGAYVTPSTDTQEQSLFDEGAVPRNYVQSVRAFRG